MPDKKKELIPLFQELSEKIGNERVIWRYDPVLISKDYSIEWHIHTFESMAEALEGYTKQAVISFLDMYRKNKQTDDTGGNTPAHRRSSLSICSESRDLRGKSWYDCGDLCGAL